MIIVRHESRQLGLRVQCSEGRHGMKMCFGLVRGTETVGKVLELNETFQRINVGGGEKGSKD